MSFHYKDIIPGFTSEENVISEFKRKVKEYFQCLAAIPVTSGTHALEVALRAAGLQRGDHVILPDFTFFATATAVAHVGLVPVYADVSREHYGLTMDSLRQRYNARVKAVIIVHLSGFVDRDIWEIKEFCDQHHLVLIEDCAQSFCCSVDGRKTGTIGDCGTFSFQSSKIVTAGEGGLVCVNNERMAAACEAIADWGMSPLYKQRNVQLPSSNFRLSAMQCYALAHQLERIEDVYHKRIERCAALQKACDAAGIESALPPTRKGWIDCPFFFPVKSAKKINMLEPREEMPLYKSAMVPAILKRFYPDLLKAYKRANSSEHLRRFESNKIIETVDFINISQTEQSPAEYVISAYGTSH